MVAPELEATIYGPEWQTAWDEFVRRSRNGHFMLERGYMDYHAHRFTDESLLFLKRKRVVAVLPAHRSADALVSHSGLPFAGLVVGPRTLHRDVRAVFLLLREHLKARGLRSFVCTPTPVHYHVVPFEDDLYLLHSLGARCTGMKLSVGYSGTGPSCQSAATTQQFRRIEKKVPCLFRESGDVAGFWSHLEDFLQRRHAAKPVHAVDEMSLLKSRFPSQIRMVLAEVEGEIVGGLLIYLTQRVQRAQYHFRIHDEQWCISSRLDLHVAQHPEFQKEWHDLGTSVDSLTGGINEDLLLRKEITGARGTVVQTWTWDVS